MPALVPNRDPRPSQAAPDAFPGWPYIDTLYDYTELFKKGSVIAELPSAARGTQVAVVGAGVSGMCAAYELLRMGLQPVIFEASGRVGGRTWSEPFAGSKLIAEMGAMRVPPSSKVFWKYAGEFRLESMDFPDPGKVLTTLYYQNERLAWEAGKKPPGQFLGIAADWEAFTEPFVHEVNAAWTDSDHDPLALAPVWQKYIDKYANVSFYDALVEGIPTWGPDELNAFGALGIGSGGFGPLYDICFLEILRLIVDALEIDQLGIKQGIGALTEGFWTTPVVRPDGTTTSLDGAGAVLLNSPVTAIGCSPGSPPQVTYTDADGNSRTRTFPAVVVATTTRAMEVMGLTLPTPGGTQALSEPVRAAIRNLHMVSSSKLFIRTATRFWETDVSVPGNIQTDELPRGVYTLAYPSSTEGVILVSYTWGDDSDKLLPLDPQQRFAAFVKVLEAASPEFAKYMRPEAGQVLAVDWQDEPGYFGAFKLNLPGQDYDLRSAYFQFQTAGTEEDTGVYLAGDGVSWSGGWSEGALETGLNAACAVAARVGGDATTFPNGSPLDQNPKLYHYAPIQVTPPVAAPVPA